MITDQPTQKLINACAAFVDETIRSNPLGRAFTIPPELTGEGLIPADQVDAWLRDAASNQLLLPNGVAVVMAGGGQVGRVVRSRRLSKDGEMTKETMARALDMGRLIGMTDLAPVEDIYLTTFKPVPTMV